MSCRIIKDIAFYKYSLSFNLSFMENTMRILLIILIFLNISCICQPSFESIKATWSKKWTDWKIRLDGQTCSMKSVWSNDWREWKVNLVGDTATIKSIWSKDWRSWKYLYDTKRITIKAVWSNSWRDWKVSDETGNTLTVRAVWNGKWTDWKIRGDNGDIQIKAVWNGKWTDWRINDNMVENIHLKMAAIFPCIITSSIIAHLDTSKKKKKGKRFDKLLL